MSEPAIEQRWSVFANEGTRSASVGNVTAPPSIHEALNSPGESLSAEIRNFMEPRLGHDFSHVRVHSNRTAAESAASIDALAYTVGKDVVFGAGQYQPNTMQGRRLLAHELSHTIQQGAENGTRSTVPI
jgi:hypothetical protein